MTVGAGSPRVRCGVDVVRISSFARAVDTTGGRLEEVCFTGVERHDASGRIDSLACRFAAKEAVAKALGVGLMRGIGFHDIEVARSESGAPDLILQREALKEASQQRLSNWALSMTHDADLAIAFVVAMEPDQSEN